MNTNIPAPTQDDASVVLSAEAAEAAGVASRKPTEMPQSEETPWEHIVGPLKRSDNLPLLVAIVVIGIIFQIAANGLFLSSRNIVNLVVQLVPLGMIALASSLLIIMGEIDLSLGSVAGVTAATGAYLMTHGVGAGWSVVLMLVAGAGIGLLQGLIVVLGQVRSFVVTLAGYLAWYGAQLYVLGKNASIPISSTVVINLSTTVVPSGVLYALAGVAGGLTILNSLRSQLARGGDTGTVMGWLPVVWRILVTAFVIWLISFFKRGGGLPIIVVILLVVVAGAAFLLENTASGRYVYAIGGNLRAALDNGIRVNLLKAVVFTLAGFLTGLAGLALLSYTAGTDSSTGGGTLLLEAIGAAVVGGVSLAGGRGSVRAALGGALLLEGVTNGLDLLNANADLVYIIEGVVVVVALLFDSTIRRRIQGAL